MKLLKRWCYRRNIWIETNNEKFIHSIESSWCCLGFVIDIFIHNIYFVQSIKTTHSYPSNANYTSVLFLKVLLQILAILSLWLAYPRKCTSDIFIYASWTRVRSELTNLGIINSNWLISTTSDQHSLWKSKSS